MRVVWQRVRLSCHFVLLAGSALTSTWAESADKIVIISPHRKSIEREFMPAFKRHYEKAYGTNIEVDWIDQSGTENNLRYIRSQYKVNPQSSQIDVFWGGGDLTFMEMDSEGYLSPYSLPPELDKELPKEAVGIALRSERQTWYAAALSSFGIFYNKRLISMLRQEEPRTWADLGKPLYRDYISMADPRHSSSSLVMNLIILNALGWEKGWQTLAAIAGNTKKFTHSSSDPIKAVVSGEATAAAAIDFYALAKVASVGEKNLGFVLPEGETVFNSDPVAILKGAPHAKAAGRFIEFVLSAPAQKLLLLPPGQKGGPKADVLGRFAINPVSYQETEGQRITALNPFQMPAPKFKLDMERVSRLKRLFGDLLGALHVDPHKDLRLAWLKISKQGLDAASMERFAAPPIREEELNDLLAKWDDNVFRNKTINAWTTKAQATYREIVAQPDKPTQALIGGLPAPHPRLVAKHQPNAAWPAGR